jgi:hypothetical protein
MVVGEVKNRVVWVLASARWFISCACDGDVISMVKKCMVSYLGIDKECGCSQRWWKSWYKRTISVVGRIPEVAVAAASDVSARHMLD